MYPCSEALQLAFVVRLLLLHPQPFARSLKARVFPRRGNAGSTGCSTRARKRLCRPRNLPSWRRCSTASTANHSGWSRGHWSKSETLPSLGRQRAKPKSGPSSTCRDGRPLPSFDSGSVNASPIDANTATIPRSRATRLSTATISSPNPAAVQLPSLNLGYIQPTESD